MLQNRMTTYKELWIQTREDFKLTIGRDPTDKEMNEIMADALGDQIEAVTEMLKEHCHQVIERKTE